MDTHRNLSRDDPDLTVFEEDFSKLASAFNSSIASYERRIGRVTRAVATHIPSLLPPLPAQPIVLDNACGTGAVAAEIARAFPTARIYATDVAPGMMDLFRAQMQSKVQWSKNVVHVSTMDGQDLHLYDSAIFDLIVMNFAIQFFPDPVQGVREIYRTLKPGGTAAISCWKELGFLPILWEVQRRIAPVEPVLTMPLLQRWMDGKLLMETLAEGGFADLRVELVEELMWGNGLEDLRAALLDNFRSLVGSQWNEDEKGKLKVVTETVLQEDSALYCTESDGKIGVKMIAFVALCTK
ncbi:hypothetical protein MMC20_000627 [Loxospora ochrophaea]|nr:hypothetical protein [Loxospora ochrophaea]